MIYYPVVRSAFAILFSFLLIATQAAAIAGTACECPRCEKACCVGNGVPASSPTVPTRSASQLDWQLTANAQVSLESPALKINLPLLSGPCLLSVAAIPLYRRNCSCLI